MTTGVYEKAKQYLEAKAKEKPGRITKPIGPCITISRQTGAGADIISELLCSKLQNVNKDKDYNWAAFDRNLIEKVIEDHQLSDTIKSYLEEKKLSEISSYISEMLGLQPPAYVLIHKTAETIIQLASLGNVIIVGRAANIITMRLPNVFHVRLIAMLDERAKHISELYNISYKDAVEHVKKMDEQRRHYFMHYYNKDINDPYLYHLIINTHLLKHEEAAEIIKSCVIKKFPQYF